MYVANYIPRILGSAASSVSHVPENVGGAKFT
jgi:hypothetical protein